MKESYAVVTRLKTGESIPSNAATDFVRNSSGEMFTPTGQKVVHEGNINTVLAAAGGAGWEKVQATTANHAITKPTSGAGLDLHIEAGGSLATLNSTNWPVPANGVDQLRIRNFSGLTKTFTAGVGWTIVTADGNPVTGGSYSIPDDRAVEITLDPHGFAQVVPWGGEVSQATFDAGLSGKSDTAHNHDTAYTAIAHGTNSSNPHSVTKTQVGLSNADNVSDVNKPVSTAQQTALNLKQDASTAATDAELTAHTGNVSNPHVVTKTQIQLGNVDNTSDANKGVSTAQQTALDGKSATSHAHTGTYEPADATILKEAEVVNTLVGTATNLPLSAAQGKVLQDGKRELYSLGHPYHTAATEAGHVVTGSSQFNADYAPWKALQASPVALSEWATANASSASLTYQLPQATVFNRVVLMGRLNGIEYPTTWSLEGSNDGTTYTTLIASHVESLQAEVTKDFTNTTAYKYYRFSYTAVVGTNVGLNHIRFFHTGINYLPILPINNTLTSTSTAEALSAAQGKILQDGKSDTTYVDTGLTSKQRTLDAIARRWTPDQDLVTGMQVMFRPEELPTTGTVTAWNDVSGNARNLSQGGTSSPSVSGVLLNGLPVVQFATASDRLTTAALPVLHGTESTMFVVFEHPAAATNAELIGQSDGSNNRRAYVSPKWSDNGLYVDYGNSSGSRISLANSPFVGDEVFHVFSARRSGTTSSEVWRNGTSVVVDNTLDTPAAFAVDAPFFVGSGSGAGNENFAGKIAEIIIYNTALTAAEREQIEGYLAHKYGLQANLPAGHTYRNAVPTVNYHIHSKDFTDWTTYTPIVTSESGGWTSYTASGRYRIVDRMLTVSFRVQFTGTPAAADGLYVSLPSGLTMNNNVMTGNAGWDADLVGFGVMGDSGTISGVPAIITTRTTQKVLVKYYNAAGAYLTCPGLSNTAPWTWAINDTVDGQFTVPIQ